MRQMEDSFKNKFISAIETAVSDKKEMYWFKNIEFRFNDESNTVVVPLQNDFLVDFYEKKFGAACRSTAENIMPSRPAFRFEKAADTPLPAETPSAAPSAGMRTADAPAAQKSAPDPASKQMFILNRIYTFENFVVGHCNRFAHGMALAVSESPGRNYNPLFVVGGVGLGKTHLLQAVCHSIITKQPRLKIHYTPCEGFVNDYIAAMQKGAMDAFRQRYRSLDILVIDDIHWLANKEGSQEEFFHTFNALHDAAKQMILSSDVSPKDIPTLEERLVTRFEWGAIAKIDAPSFETRVAFLRNKAEMLGKTFPDDVLEFISNTITNNFRELEGAIKNVGIAAEVTGQEITLALARDIILKNITHSSAVQTSTTDILNAVARAFGIKVSDLQSQKRRKSVSMPRQIAVYLTKRLTNFSLEEIGAFFGGKNHSTIMYSIDKVEEYMKNDPIFRQRIEGIESELRSKNL